MFLEKLFEQKLQYNFSNMLQILYKIFYSRFRFKVVTNKNCRITWMWNIGADREFVGICSHKL